MFGGENRAFGAHDGTAPYLLVGTPAPLMVLRKRVWDYSQGESVWRLKMVVAAGIKFLRSAGRQHGPTDSASEASHDHGVDDVALGHIAAERRPLPVGCVTRCRASS